MRSNAARLLPEFREFQRRKGAPSHYRHLAITSQMASWSFGMPQAEVTDFVEAARQHMLEEAANKLVAAETTGMSAASLAVLVLDRDRLVVEADDPGVGESDTEDVAGEVVEHRLFAIAPGADVKHPAFAPDRVRDDEIRALPL